jgi:hypothetical protein
MIASMDDPLKKIVEKWDQRERERERERDSEGKETKRKKRRD